MFCFVSLLLTIGMTGCGKTQNENSSEKTSQAISHLKYQNNQAKTVNLQKKAVRLRQVILHTPKTVTAISP